MQPCRKRGIHFSRSEKRHAASVTLDSFIIGATEKKRLCFTGTKNVPLSANLKMTAEDANTDQDRMSFLEGYADSNVI